MRTNEIGLLLCDHLDEDVAAAVGDLDQLFRQAFDAVGLTLKIYDVTGGEMPGSPQECAGWITSGSRFSAYDDEPWIAELSKFIVAAAEQKVPHAGICFGHQLIAQALGGRVERADVGWGVGIKEFDVVSRTEWMTPAAETFRILMSHQDQVVELPPGAEIVATANYCPIGGYRIGHHVFCVQGHPEFTPELVSLLIQKRRPRLGDEVADAGLASLEVAADRSLTTGWVASFLGVGRLVTTPGDPDL